MDRFLWLAERVLAEKSTKLLFNEQNRKVTSSVWRTRCCSQTSKPSISTTRRVLIPRNASTVLIMYDNWLTWEKKWKIDLFFFKLNLLLFLIDRLNFRLIVMNYPRISLFSISVIWSMPKLNENMAPNWIQSNSPINLSKQYTSYSPIGVSTECLTDTNRSSLFVFF